MQHIHPVDGQAIGRTLTPVFRILLSEPRNVRLELVVDGFNPFDNHSQSYSMWMVILTTYNLPPWLCMKESSFMLTQCRDNRLATGLKFKMKRWFMDQINDFPARNSFSGWSGQGYRACPTCNEDTLYVCVLGKIAYVGYKRFLKKPHKLRRSLEFNGETENGYPPREFSRDAIMSQLTRLPTLVQGKHPKFGV
ncbi:hypothetical protein Tco_0542132 [Tanacetum coccineum]